MPRPGDLLPHVDDGPDAVASLHRLERLVDLADGVAVRDELVHLELALKVVVDEAGELRPALDAAERRALPDAARNELERCEGVSKRTTSWEWPWTAGEKMCRGNCW